MNNAVVSIKDNRILPARLAFFAPAFRIVGGEWIEIPETWRTCMVWDGMPDTESAINKLCKEHGKRTRISTPAGEAWGWRVPVKAWDANAELNRLVGWGWNRQIISDEEALRIIREAGLEKTKEKRRIK